MLLIIQIALGMVLGSTLAIVITCMCMFNYKFVTWFTKMYMKYLERIVESLTKE